VSLSVGTLLDTFLRNFPALSGLGPALELPLSKKCLTSYLQLTLFFSFFFRELNSKSRAFLIHECNQTPFHHSCRSLSKPRYLCFTADVLQKESCTTATQDDLTGLRGITKSDQMLRLEKMEMGCVVILSDTNFEDPRLLSNVR
jgi:hypothetical protein